MRLENCLESKNNLEKVTRREKAIHDRNDSGSPTRVGERTTTRQDYLIAAK